MLPCCILVQPAATHWLPPIVFIYINCTSVLQRWDVCCGQRVLTAHVFDPPHIRPWRHSSCIIAVSFWCACFCCWWRLMHRAERINTLYNMMHTRNNHNLFLHKYQWIKERQRQKGKVFVIFIVTCIAIASPQASEQFAWGVFNSVTQPP